MSPLRRLVATVAAASLATVASLTAVSAIWVGLIHHAASATIPPLAALDSTPLGGSTVYADDGRTVLAVLTASQTRTPVALKQVAPVMVTAALDTEDHRFFIHGGFDIPSIARAMAADSSGSGGLQGGSTIAQQLVKQTYLTSERKLSRKVKEAVLADRLERHYSKDQILQAYLNTIYLGNGAYGVEAAAKTYFGEHASQLTLPQSAMLAGLIQNPSGYDPILQPADSRQRRAVVLDRMRHYGDITPAQEASANASPLPTSVILPPVQADQVSDYYVGQVVSELLGAGSPLGGTYDQRYQALFEGSLQIYTNLDPATQASAENAVTHDTPANNRGFQEAMVAVDPTSGKVRAMVGGSNFNQDHFDVITQGTRQPGSGFKLFTLLAALQKGYSIFDTLDGQSPCAINFPTDHDLVTHPAHNDEGDAGAGVLTLQQATALSVNCAFIRLAHEVGLSNVISMAHSLGISSDLPAYPSIVIGSSAVHPIELAGAYATVANGGVYHRPTFIDHIVDRSGSTIFIGADPGHRVLPQQIAQEATVALQSVIQFGTGAAATLYNRPAAGKTGTTDNTVDAWFNGFTPQLEATVWMGSGHAEVPMVDVGGVAQVYGGTFPAVTWRDFMSSALANQPVLGFAPPDYGSLPAPVYITSPSLVQDDVLNHNGVYVNPYQNYYGNNAYPPNQGGGGTGPSQSTSPSSSPAPAPTGHGHGH
ncbi:MAG TPA: transglycosylase domain-containing protein [Acidimicrobiales bacterium]|nr:transglycosylase domain-containing protein [Acidimicrobiales bacterium]